MSLVAKIRQSQAAARASASPVPGHIREKSRELIALLGSFDWHCDPAVIGDFRSLAARVAGGDALTDQDRRAAIALLNRILGALTDEGHPDRLLMGEALVDEVRTVFRK